MVVVMIGLVRNTVTLTRGIGSVSVGLSQTWGTALFMAVMPGFGIMVTSPCIGGRILMFIAVTSDLM
jgi:hypothetical protein